MRHADQRRAAARARARRLPPSALRLLTAVGAVLFAAACGSEPHPTAPEADPTALAGAVSGQDTRDDAPGTVRFDPDAIDLRVGESAEVTATVLNAAGQSVPEQTVAFSSGDEAVASVASTGPTTASVTAEGAGETTVTGTREARSGSASVSVRKWRTSLTTSDASGLLGDDITLSATLLREDGSPVVGAPVTLTVSGSVVATPTTDGSGEASADVGGSDLGAGEHAFTFAYAGSQANEGSSAEGTLEVLRRSSSLTIDGVSFTGAWGAPAVIAVVLTDASSGDPLADEEVTLTSGFGDATATTDADGKATLGHEVEADLGEHAFTVSFAGSATHVGSSAESTVTVTRVPVVVESVETEELPWGTSGAVRLRLTTPGGDVAAGVEVRIDQTIGATVTATSGSDGWVDLPGFNVAAGTHTWSLNSVTTLSGPLHLIRGAAEIPTENGERELSVLHHEVRIGPVRVERDFFRTRYTLEWIVIDETASSAAGGVQLAVTVVLDGDTVATGSATSDRFGRASFSFNSEDEGSATVGFEVEGASLSRWTLPEDTSVRVELR